MIGSHLDSQPTGGKYDGVYGVLAGLEVIETLNDHNLETEHAIEVVSWTNEEGARFAPAMVSSGVFAGVFDLDYAYSREDKEGNKRLEVNSTYFLASFLFYSVLSIVSQFCSRAAAFSINTKNNKQEPSVVHPINETIKVTITRARISL